MNKRIVLTNLGGFPFTQASLEFMQSSYREAFIAIAKLCGDKTILTGVVNTAGVISDGWISYNGELIPFVGGAATAGVVIQETSTQLTFQDGVDRDAYFTKVAFCGSPQTFAFSELKRLQPVKDMWLPGDVKQVDCSNVYVAANFDSTGLGIGERLGWAVCNGNNGTLNRGGRVSIGYTALDIDPADNVWDAVYNNLGATGGEKKHLLTIDEIPSHQHNIVAGGFLNKGGGDGANVVGSEAGSNNAKTGLIGGGSSHENRTPFIVTLFIQKL